LTIDQIIELQKIEYIYNKCLPRSIISKKNVQSSKKRLYSYNYLLSKSSSLLVLYLLGPKSVWIKFDIVKGPLTDRIWDDGAPNCDLC